MDDLNQLLRSTRQADLCDENLRNRLIDNLINRLSSFIGMQVAVEASTNSIVEVGSVLIHAISTRGDGLRFSAKGILVVQDDAQQGLRITGVLFLYFSDKRVCLSTGESFLDIEFRSDSGDAGDWVAAGWFKDEYGEYTNW